jgi:hypothetical protein
MTQKRSCKFCGWSREYPDHFTPAQITHAMHVERELNLEHQLSQSGGTHDAKRLLQQRRRRPGMKPNAVV